MTPRILRIVLVAALALLLGPAPARAADKLSFSIVTGGTGGAGSGTGVAGANGTAGMLVQFTV